MEQLIKESKQDTAEDLLEALYQILELPEDSRIAYKIARKAILKATEEGNV